MYLSSIPRVTSRASLLALVATACASAPALAKAGSPASAHGAVTSTATSVVSAVTQTPATFQSLAAEATAAIAAGPNATVSTDGCGSAVLSQPFLSWNDQNEYTLAPGESADSFDGTGWTLSGGASIEAVTLADGGTGNVLDLPSGGYAVSPPMCVASDYPTARTMVQTTGNGTQVGVGVFYAANKAAQQLQFSGVAQSTGKGGGFTLSNALQVHPGNQSGWQMVQFLFGATGLGGDAQIYNFYVDPRMAR